MAPKKASSGKKAPEEKKAPSAKGGVKKVKAEKVVAKKEVAKGEKTLQKHAIFWTVRYLGGGCPCMVCGPKRAGLFGALFTLFAP